MTEENKTREELLAELTRLRERLTLRETPSDGESAETPATAPDSEEWVGLDWLAESATYEDMQGVVLWANRAAGESAGLLREQVVGRHCYEIWRQRNVEHDECPVQDVRETGRPAQGEVAASDGRLWLVQGYPVRGRDGRVSGVLEIAAGVDSREPGEQAPGAAADTYRELFEKANDAIFVADAETGVIIDANTRAAELLDLPRDQILGMHQTELHPDDSPDAYRQIFEKHAKSPESVARDLFVRRRNGTLVPVEISASTIETGSQKLLLGIFRDQTERKQADAERLRLAAAVDQAAESIVITDVDGLILYVNPCFEQVTGYSREEALGKTMRILKSGKQDNAFYAKLWRSITRGETWKGHIINKRKDGTLYEEEAVIFPLRNSRGETANYVAVKRDVTNEVTMAKRLQQAQRMEAVGQLAGGVAHDFNNLLLVIENSAAFVKDELPESSPAHREIADILEAARRAAGLTRQLLAFSRRQAIAPRALDLNEILRGVEKMLRRLIREDIELLIATADEPCQAKVDAGQIEQVIINLVVNARDAMPNGGKLTIETMRVNGDLVHETGMAPDGSAGPERPYVVLCASDTGMGMDEETKSHIFEPFFTTKDVGEGTGLGLATVCEIVKQHGGHMTVYSEPDAGTTFKAYFPALVRQRRLRPQESTSHSLPRGDETVLLAEDDPIVRRVGEKMLRVLGYRVLSASSGEEAIKLVEGSSEEIHLLFSDMIMPGMDGKTLAGRLRQLRPGVKLLFASGYPQAHLAQQSLLIEGAIVLQKPFVMSDVARTIREVLDG